MRRMGLIRGMLQGAVLCAVIAAATLQSFAAASIRLSDGSLLSVWEARTRARSQNGDGLGSFLAYSISGPAGIIQGTIAGTEDSARDGSPRLAIDPVSGNAVVLWSRFDGVYNKIAYARLEGAAWLDLHLLTFGSGDDTEPRVVVARDGAFVFYIAQADRYLSFPVDLSTGRLLGSPHELPPGPRGPGVSTQASQDVPVVVHGNGSGSKGHLSLWSPSGNLTVSGNSDVPVVVGGDNHGRASLWGASGIPACRNAVVVLPNPAETLLRILSYSNGSAREIGRVHLPASIPDGLADQTAAAYLNAYCN